MERAWSALSLIGETIKDDEMYGTILGAEEVEEGLDAMAEALAKLKDPESAGGSLDEVLAEMGEDDAIVGAAAELIELVGQVGYMGWLPSKSTVRAEMVREKLYGALDELLRRLEKE